MDVQWSKWKVFPDPRNMGILYAPIGPGVYEVRNRHTGQMILFGSGKNCAYRMTSLLPPPFGQGTRENADKRKYLWKNIEDLEYRCAACSTNEKRRELESKIKTKGNYRFPL